MNDRDARELCIRTAQMLDERVRVLRFSLLVTLIAIVSFALFAWRGLAVAPLLLSGAASVLGLVNLRLLMHLGFDARVFAQWAEASDAVAESMAAFDRTMTGHFNMPADKAARPIAARVAGVLRLLRLAFMVAAVQLVLLLAAWLLIRVP